MTLSRLVQPARTTTSRPWRLGARLAAIFALSIGLFPVWACSDSDGTSQGNGPATDAAAQQDAGDEPDAASGPDADPGLDAVVPDAEETDAVVPDAPVTDAAQSDGEQQDAAPASPGTISVQALHDALPVKDFLLINVHVPYQGEIPQTDAKISYLQPDAVAAFVGTNLDQHVVVYCMSNYMSTIAGQDLVDRGYRNVQYLDGGMSGWTAAGYTLENNP